MILQKHNFVNLFLQARIGLYRKPLTDIPRAARFNYLRKVGFCGKVNGRTFCVGTTCPP
jgi:hypothetical protein